MNFKKNIKLTTLCDRCGIVYIRNECSIKFHRSCCEYRLKRYYIKTKKYKNSLNSISNLN